VKQDETHPSVIQQLMFNRILASVRLLWVDHVTVTAFDVKTGTIMGNVAGVEFVVSVSVPSSTA
jgi:hypothetical protein